MAKRKRTKGQTTIYKTYTINQRSGNTNPTKPGGELMSSGRISSSEMSEDQLVYQKSKIEEGKKDKD